MYRLIGIIGLLCLATTLWAAKTPLDLMIEGRYKEAKTILDNSNVSPRYQLIYYALLEADAARACSLYQVIAIRYPETDCDSVARARLNQAQDMGYVLIPVAEWAEAPNSVAPLELRRPEPVVAEEEPVVATTEPIEESPSADSDAIDESPPVVEPEVSEPEEVVESEPKEVGASVTDLAIPIPTPEIGKTEPPMGTEPIAEAAPESNESSDTIEPDLIETAPTAEPTAEVIESPADVSTSVAEEPAPITDEPVVKDIVQPPPVAEAAVTETPAIEAPTPVAVDVTPAVEPEAVPPASAVPEEITASEPSPPETARVAEVGVQPEEEMSVAADRPASNGHYYIQVGAFGNFDNAHKLAKDLQKAGFPVKLVMRENPDRKLLQVRVGGYPSKAAAEPIRDRLKKEYELPTVIVTE
ncbi:MAG: SPOR domain-containing protein [Calditrichota bacterium]